MMLLSSFYRAVFLSWLLLAIVEESVTVSGQGVTVDLNGVTLPNDSLVDFNDIPDVSSSGGAENVDVLNCRTNLVACCNAGLQSLPAPVGEWYYPNGTALPFDTSPGGGTTFRRNRLLMNVRLWRRNTPTGRGRFRCELPNAQNVNQIVYVNILNIGQVTITASGGSNTGIAGTSFSLVCSATVETQNDTPTPNFDWFFGTNNGSLPSGATPTATDTGNNYTSTLQFSPLQESHAGMYTCRLGSNARLAVNAMVTVNRPDITATVSASGSPVLGQSVYSLTCDVTGEENLSSTRTYQWTRDNGTMTQVGTNSNSLFFSSLRLSDAGRYTCSVTISSPYLVNDITLMDSLDITFSIPAPVSVTLSSSITSPIRPVGSDVILNCSVVLNSGTEFNIPLTVNVDISSLTTTAPSVSGSTYTSTATVTSFDRGDSGVYTCTATVSSMTPNTYLTESEASGSLQLITGVYLTLRGQSIGNNNNVNISDIGLSTDNPNGALQCITDRNPCCTNPRLGEWYLPDGGIVQGLQSTTEFYRNRGASGQVILNRPNVTMSPTGRFCCEVADYNDNNQTVCVIIGGVSVSTSSGSPTAGEAYSLVCSAGGSTATFQWLGPPDGMTPVDISSSTISIASNSTTSQLQFMPLQQSHNGSYTCNASADGQNLNSNPVIISVNAPSISVQVSEVEGILTSGQNFDLSCIVLGAENINPTIVYQWIKSNGSQTIVRTDSTTLSFTPLGLSSASRYICMVTITSSYLTGDFVAMDSQEIRVQIPTASLMVTSNVANFIQVGSDVTLTCAIEFGTTVVDSDLSLLMVDTQLSRDGTPLTLTGPTVTGTTFTYTIQLDSFGRNDSGNYNCTATVGPKPTSSYLVGEQTLSNEVRVTTGVYLYLKGELYPNNSHILITEIGQTMDGEEVGGALLCYTDNVECCSNTSTVRGRWLLPDQTEVGTESEGGAFYVDGGPSVVRLHRRNNDTSSTGVFCCEVPDATNVVRRSCVNIIKMFPTTDTDATPSSTVDVQSSMTSTGAIAGGAAGGVVLLIVLILIVVVVVAVSKRRGRGKPYEVASSKQSVLYANTSNREKVHVLGIGKDGPQIVEFPTDSIITEGEGVYFKIKVSGVPQPTVTWYHDGEPVKADYAREVEEDGSLAIPSTELKHSGVYRAVVANQHGSEEREVKLTVSEEGGATTLSATANGMVSSRPVPIPEFGKYVSELHSNANQPFKDLYQSLDTGEEGHSIEYATNRERKPLNRFGNIVVYDDNRIPLNPLPDAKDCQRDYVNACYVDGYSIPKKFIATQGPLPKTLIDFWRLVWQERPPTIVMVTNVKEGNRIKCQQYWPESGKKEFGPFQVIIADQQIFADYTVRTLSLSFGSGRSHKVTQYHFTAWPDHGVPDYATPILAFHRRVKAQHHPSRGPMLVHCSAGVGRTGTFIVIDNILEQIEKEQVVDIPGAITKIRQKRMKMVQTHEQFTFIHDAILESVTCGDTQISATNLRMNIAKMKKKDVHNQPYGFQYQFKILDQVSPNPEEVHCGGALTYPDRSRSNKYLPGDRWRVVLKGEQPDYIHAVNINGYKHKRAFIVAEGPMQNTVRNFWKMVYDRKCAVVVMVSGLMEEGQEASAQYWPDNGIDHYGEFAVDLLGEEPLEGFTIRTLSVMDTKTQRAHQVTQFHITCWTLDGCCSNLKSITDVIEEMTKVQIRSGNKPIVVHCNDTVTRSGMFCAIATTIERCKTEGVVDVFQVVKALRVQKPGAVPTVENFKLIFNAILVYLESFDTYANFQNI